MSLPAGGIGVSSNHGIFQGSQVYSVDGLMVNKLNSGTPLQDLHWTEREVEYFLECYGDGITSLVLDDQYPLENIKHCKNLENLQIHLFYPLDFSYISNLKGLKSLGIHVQNPWTVEYMNEVSQLFKQFPDLQKLSFTASDACDIEDEAVLTLLKGLEGHSKLTEITFEALPIVSREAAAMGTLLERQTQLQKFELKVCDFEGLDAAKALFGKLKNHAHLEELILPYNTIDSDSFMRMGPEGAESLADALEGLPSLQKIDLSGNDIGARGAKAISKKLGELTHLNNKEITILTSDSLLDRDRVEYRIEKEGQQHTQIKLICSSAFQVELAEDLSELKHDFSDNDEKRITLKV